VVGILPFKNPAGLRHLIFRYSADAPYREEITEGLALAPEAFIRMLSGRNFGKTLVHVSRCNDHGP
jgi:NADPH-dependent curcumin reductase CurA